MESESRPPSDELTENAPSPAPARNNGTPKRRRKFLLSLLFIGLVPLAGAGWWYAQAEPEPFRIVTRGSRGVSDGLGISGGNLVVIAPKPGVFFGTVKKAWSEEEFTYLVLFKLPRPTPGKTGYKYRTSSPSDARKAETMDAITLSGKSIEATYRIELNETRSAVANESLTLNGKNVDPASGRLFLIDLTAEQPAFQQKKVELPAIPSTLESQDFEGFVESIRTNLASRDQEIAAFLR